MWEETRLAIAILAFIIFFPVMMLISLDPMELRYYEVREVKEEN